MRISDLYQIGRLGNFINEDGYIQFKKDDSFQPDYLSINDFFLIFSKNRVRFVTKEHIIESDRKILIKFKEPELLPDLAGQKVKVCLSKKDINFIQAGTDYINTNGFNVMFKQQLIGVVVDFFDNGAHGVIVVKNVNEKEFMIPFIDIYISKISEERRLVFVQDVEDLITLCE